MLPRFRKTMGLITSSTTTELIASAQRKGTHYFVHYDGTHCFGAEKRESLLRPLRRNSLFRRREKGIITSSTTTELIISAQRKGNHYFVHSQVIRMEWVHWVIMATFIGSLIGKNCMSSGNQLGRFLGAGLWLMLLNCAVGPAFGEGRKPNFIVVFCDNLGYGDIQPFGSTLHRTPQLNRMAKQGRKFTHFCVTAGVCTPSRASLMTGCYAQRVGMHRNKRDGAVLRPVSPYGLNPDEVTIADVLKQQGYATAIIGKWHLGDQPEFLPTRQGFDWFFGLPYSDDMTKRVWQQDGSEWPPLPLMENERVIEAPCDRDSLTKRYTEKAVAWITEHKDEPFFLYLPQAMPGSTSSPFSSARFRGKSKNGAWGDAIEELDWSMGVVLDRLQELGIAEDTLVIWTSDNGAPINRDLSNLGRGSNQPLHGRGYTTSEGAFRVPTIVWQPGKVPAGTVCQTLATTMDLLPTFAELAGADLSQDRKIDGYDISSLLFGNGPTKSPYKAFFYYHQDQLQAVRSGPWKLFLPVKPSGAHPHFNAKRQPETLLFHLLDDTGCTRNVALEHPETVARLLKLAESARRDLGDKGRAGLGQRECGRIDREPVPQMLLGADD